MILDEEQQKTLDIAIAPMLGSLLAGLQTYWGLTFSECFYEIAKSLSRLEKQAEREVSESRARL